MFRLRIDRPSCRIIAAVAALIFAGCAALPFASSGGGSGSAGTNAGATAGAAGTTTYLPSPSVFDFVGKSTRIRYVGPAALLSDSTDVDADLLAEQCAFHSADPPFLVPRLQAPDAWTFAGRLNQGDTLQALEYKSLLTLGFVGNQQLNTWPVNLILLSDFPDEYLKDRLSMLGAAKLPEPEQRLFVERYREDANKIQTVVLTFIRSFNDDECSPGADD